MRNEPSGVRADRGRSYNDIERYAVHVRRQLEMSPAHAIDALQLFEDLDEIAVRDSTGQDIPLWGKVVAIGDSEGFTKYACDRRQIEIAASPTTYERLERGHPRASYFVAHELGHCLLHTDQLVRLARVPRANQAAFHRGAQETAHEVYLDTEWQANAFASSLLMPARGLLALEIEHGELCPGMVADHFHVSTEAASYRLELYNERKPQLLSGPHAVARA